MVPLVTRDLTRHLEAAEAAYHEAKLSALGAGDGTAQGVEIARLGQTILLSIQSRRHNPSYNRAMCFSEDDEEHLDDVLRWLRDRADAFWFDVAPALVDQATLRRLGDAGLCPSFFLNVVYTVPSAADDPHREAHPARVVVEPVCFPEQAHDFAVVLCRGFGVPGEYVESAGRSAQVEYAAPEWHAYLALVDGDPAAMATLYVDGDTASIDGMATVPRHREKGCQTALLRRCIADAARAGCTLLASQTRPSSASERNMLRAGLRIAYTKALYSARSGQPG